MHGRDCMWQILYLWEGVWLIEQGNSLLQQRWQPRPQNASKDAVHICHLQGLPGQHVKFEMSVLPTSRKCHTIEDTIVRHS